MTSSQTELTIDFAKLGGPVYVGRSKGEAVRQRLKLDQVDADDGSVRVLIPEATYSINSSYFLGLFGKSIRSSGSKEKFVERYKFHASPEKIKKIETYIIRALHENDSLL